MNILTKNENKLIDVLQSLNNNDKITLVYNNSFGFPVVMQAKFHSVEVKENYSQRFIYLISKPKSKREYRRLSLDHKDLIMLNGWHDIDNKAAINMEKVGNATYETWTSFDNTFLKEVALIWEKETLYSNIDFN